MKKSTKPSLTATPASLKNSLLALEQKLGPIELRPIHSLKAYPRNPRKHPERQIAGLEASILEFGYTIPAVISPAGEIIAGEARIEAARRVGLEEVPVLVAHNWSAAQTKAYRLADNRLAEHATWDNAFLAAELVEIMSVDEFSIDLLGWETAEIDVITEQERVKEVESIDAPDPADSQLEPPATPVSRAGDVWLAAKHRILCGSSLDEANWTRLMNGATAAMSFNDSPFNVPVAGHVCGLGKVQHSEFAMASGEMSPSQFVEFLTTFLTRLAAHCRDGAVIDVCMDWRHISELYEALAAAGLTILNLCVWNKSNGGMGSLYRSKYELVAIAKKGKAPHCNNVQLGRNGRYRTNVWDYAGVNSFGATRMQDLADHPTVKPVALVADAIRDVTAHGDIVVDAFLGSGTSILAAERTGRIAYGIEIEAGYVDVSIRRWETMTGLAAVLEETGETFAEVAARRGESAREDEDDGGGGEGENDPFDEAA